jgi:tRNA(Ile)-lysidine synthase
VIERLKDHLERQALIPPNTKVLLGYSGGADSTCLLHLLSEIGIPTIAAHLHHGQRPEADDELEMCRRFAESLGAGFVSGQADVPRLAQEHKIGLEEAGRKARYAFLDQAARHWDCPLIATAHTQTDHVETVLHHLTRGCGLPGLAGIPEKRGNLIRPLLIFTREETRAYCQEKGLPFHDDPANANLDFSRARIRHRILPELKAINPSVQDAVSRMAQLVSQENRFLNGMAAAALEKAEQPLNGDLRFLTQDIEVAFRRPDLEALPEVLLSRAIRLAVETLGASLDLNETSAFTGGLRNGTTGSITAEGGTVVVEWNPKVVHVRELQDTPAFQTNLTFPGETSSPEMGWKLTAFESPTAQKPQRRSLAAEIGIKQLQGHMFLRSPKPADKMQPLGFNGHRKVSDLIGESKLTEAARSRLPIICDMVGPLWIPGICLDERAKPQENDKVAVLRFEPQ